MTVGGTVWVEGVTETPNFRQYTPSKSLMVSDEPRPERCGATITNKVGLEIHDSVAGDVYRGDGRLQDVVIERGDETQTVDADYSRLIHYTLSDFKIKSVLLSGDEAGETKRVPVEDDDPELEYTDKEVDGYCEKYPVQGNSRCHYHGGNNDGPPEGNTNSVTHGFYADRSNYYKNELSAREKQTVHEFVDDWIGRADFTRDNRAMTNELYRIAVDQIRLWKGQDEMTDGMVVEQEVEMGDQVVEVEDENPANLPYDRLDRTTYSKLKSLGVLDDPESQKADSIESLTDKFSDS